MTRPRLWFDGEPDRFRYMRSLFSAESRLRQRPEWAVPDRARFRLRLTAEQWMKKWAQWRHAA